MMTSVQALRWHSSELELIDQRLLPHTLSYVRCHSAAEVAMAIRDMVVRGAPAIACAAAYGIALEANRQAGASQEVFKEALNAAFVRLEESRPTAVNLRWALDRMRLALSQGSPADSKETAELLEGAARTIFQEDLSANISMGAAGAGLIPAGARIMTHCNTGGLATAGYGTALGVIRAAHQQGKHISVIANETRPYLQGARLTAWELSQENIPVVIATDSMAGHLMQQGMVDLVIVGADRIAANGDVANKIGTYTLAVLAQRHSLPFYVAAPRSSIDMESASGQAIPIEQRSAAEVLGFGGVVWGPPGVAALHPAFDVTPAELVSALITEGGVVRQPNEATLRELLAASTA